MKKLTAIMVAVCLPLTALAAPQYIDFKPLEQVVKTPVSSVKDNANTLPIITWGGDIATIYANGSSARTVNGSIFARNGLNYRLEREDDFSKQVEAYLSGRTPYLRGTMGMIATASELLSQNPATKPVVFYQMTWSAGGDALVVKDSIRNAKDLRGKTIAVQAYGPHVDYLNRVLKDANLSAADVTIKWLPDLTGTDNSPMAALYEADIDAAFVIIPDALALTSGGNIGSGAEDSVKGARILMSTKTASRVISDVYAVRADYYKENQAEVESLASSLLQATDELKQLVKNKHAEGVKYQKTFRAAAELLLDAPEALADTEGLYADCEFSGLNGNLKFFIDANYPRNFGAIATEASSSLYGLGLLKSSNSKLVNADLNYKSLATNFTQVSVESPRFDSSKVSALVSRKQQQGSLADDELYSFEVFFAPNQNNFSADLYKADFDQVIELAATYGGAIITVEGHSDPSNYLRSKKKGSQPVVLGRIKQSAKNLSVTRAQTVRNSILQYAQLKSVIMDESQFEPLGLGIAQPATGICGVDPCAPQNAKEWRSNMRVVFRIISVEAESDVFMPI